MKEYNIADYLNPKLSKEIIEELVKENAELKAENEIARQAAKDFCKINEAYMKYEDCLKEIKKITENVCKDDCPDLKRGYCIGLGECSFMARKQIIDLITKAEVGE